MPQGGNGWTNTAVIGPSGSGLHGFDCDSRPPCVMIRSGAARPDLWRPFLRNADSDASSPHADSAAPHPTPTVTEVRRWVAEVVGGAPLERERAEALASALHEEGILQILCEGALAIKRAQTGDRVTVSRNLFIPLTNLCRNRCTYCTFAKMPEADDAHTYSLEEVEETIRGGVATGCIEALMCLGDKPEIAYRSYREMLAGRGM